MKSIPTYSCPRSADVPLAPGFPPHPRNQPPAFGHETDRAKLGALIAAISFRVRFSGSRPRAGLGSTPHKQRGVALFAFFEVPPQRTAPVPPPPEFATGTFPSALITTTCSGGRRGAGWRRFPKFSGPLEAPPRPPKPGWEQPRGPVARRIWGSSINPGGQKSAPKPANLAGLLRSGQRGRVPVAGGSACPGWGSLFSLVSELSLAARHEFPTPATAMSPLSRLSAR